ncbi:transmembrane protein, putative [Bodo saltans]|uniref:Transmembrane protein, putative n=1 Tax=Bodo saltans TaxID=75058 RepID=A0A0S4J3S0_BODSA|nr:transmembrane protein, putative [Bodo saltans]|eukprot:CUG79195.1 transmembrane protein, putative [Bodo saltans]
MRPAARRVFFFHSENCDERKVIEAKKRRKNVAEARKVGEFVLEREGVAKEEPISSEKSANHNILIFLSHSQCSYFAFVVVFFTLDSHIHACFTIVLFRERERVFFCFLIASGSHERIVTMNAARVVAPPPPSAVSRRRAAWYARAACVVALVLVVVVGANNWGTESNFLHTSSEIPSWRTNSTATTGDRDTELNEARHQKPRLGVATATAAASLRTMRNECAATFGHPAPVGLTTVPSSPASPTVVPNNVVCVHRNKLYVDMEETTADVDVSATSIGVKKSRGDPPSSRPRRFEQDANVFSDTSLENFLAARGGNTAVHPPIFHSNSFAIVLSALWNSVNFFHMLMDGLVPAMYWIETTLPFLHDNHHSDAQQHSDDANRPTSSLDLKVVHMGDKKFLYTDNKKSLCTTCVAYSARAMVMAKNASSLEATIGNAVVGDVVVDRAIVADGSPASTTLPASSSSSSSSAVRFSDEELHCFCGAAVFGMNRLAKFSKERELGITAFRHRLVRSYGELAYGLAPRVEHYTRLGFWAGNKSTVGMPRLLLVNRNRRRIGNFDKIEVMAKEIGFNVATVYFENMAPDAQFHLSRYADVLVGIHGMALTFVANMDGEFRGVSDHESTGTASVATSSCKTLVELMHWINPTKFYIYREMAQLSGVAFSRLLPTSVSFGSSVENPAKEKVLLQKRNYYWWSLKGFDDQTVVFHEGQVRDVLLEAYQRAKRCSPV